MGELTQNLIPVVTHGKNKTTKWIIFTKALELFSLYGIEAVSMRNIGNAAGIAAGSIYSHFPSKECLVDEMYTYYEEQTIVVDEYVKKMACFAETDTPRQYLERCIVRLPEADNMYVTQILHIAMSRMRTDDKARRLIEKRFDTDMNIVRSTLSRMRNENKIKPIDVDTYINIYQYMCFSASYNLNTSLAVPFQRWQDMNNLFFSFILKEDDLDAQ